MYLTLFMPSSQAKASGHDLLLALQAFPVMTVTHVLAHHDFLSLFSRTGIQIAVSCLPSGSSGAPPGSSQAPSGSPSGSSAGSSAIFTGFHSVPSASLGLRRSSGQKASACLADTKHRKLRFRSVYLLHGCLCVSAGLQRLQ